MGHILRYFLVRINRISFNTKCLLYLGSSCLPRLGPNSKFDFGRPVGWFSISKLTFDFSISFLKTNVRHKIIQPKLILYKNIHVFLPLTL